MTTATDFLAAHQISFRCERIARRPDNPGWGGPDHSHFRCEFRSLECDTSMVVYFTQGPAHTKGPTAEDVLVCIQMDARSGMDCIDALDFASEFGYDLVTVGDRKRVRETYAACKKTAADLDHLLGDHFEEFMELELEA